MPNDLNLTGPPASSPGSEGAASTESAEEELPEHDPVTVDYFSKTRGLSDGARAEPA